MNDRKKHIECRYSVNCINGLYCRRLGQYIEHGDIDCAETDKDGEKLYYHTGLRKLACEEFEKKDYDKED